MPARMLSLLSLLQSRRNWSGGELAERLDVTERTVRRDIDRLRELGYPVHSGTGATGGYQLGPGANLPPLLLDDEEAVAVAVGLRTAAGGTVAGIEESSVRALAKLEQVLPARLRRSLAAIGDVTVRGPRPEEPRIAPETLMTLATACRDQTMLSFDYQSRSGEPSARRIEPHSLVHTHGLWYLVAYDPDRLDWRVFRVDRVSQAMLTHRHVAPRPLPAVDAATYVARSVIETPYRYTTRVTVYASAEAVLVRAATLIPGRVRPVDEHTCVVHLGADSLDALTWDLVALGADFHLDGPPALLDQLRAVEQRLSHARRCR